MIERFLIQPQHYFLDLFRGICSFPFTIRESPLKTCIFYFYNTITKEDVTCVK